MKRLCGLLCFCTGFGMTWVLILPDSFYLWVTAVFFMVFGYVIFCSR